MVENYFSVTSAVPAPAEVPIVPGCVCKTRRKIRSVNPTPCAADGSSQVGARTARPREPARWYSLLISRGQAVRAPILNLFLSLIPHHYSGQSIKGMDQLLNSSADSELAVDPQPSSAVALEGTMERVRVSFGYKLGLLVVTVAMLLLPLIYLGL